MGGLATGWLTKITRNLYVIALATLAIAIVAALVRGELRSGVIAAIAFVLAACGLLPALFALVLGVLLGSWLVAGCLMLVAATYVAPHGQFYLQHIDDPDETLLASAVDGLPAVLLRDLRAAAGVGSVLSTRDLLVVATRTDAPTWKPLLGTDPGAGAWDGPLLNARPASGTCTLFAAEACALAVMMADEFGRPIDRELLGAAATTVATSAAWEWTNDLEAVSELLGVSLLQLVRTQTAFSRTPAGRDFGRRWDIVVRVHRNEYVDLPREQLAAMRPRDVLWLRIQIAGSFAWIVVCAVAALPRDFARTMLALLRRPAERVRSTRHEPETRIVRTPWRPEGHVVDVDGNVVGDSNLGVTSGTEGPEAHERPGPWSRVTAPWSTWPRLARLTWLVLRPALSVAAVAAAIAADEVGWRGACLVAIAALIRPVRLWWLHVVLVAGVALVSPVAAVALAARGLITELLLVRLARATRDADDASASARTRAIAELIAARKRMLERVLEIEDLAAPPEAEARLLAAAKTEDLFDLIDPAAELVTSAWAQLRPRAFLRSVWFVFRGALGALAGRSRTRAI